MPHCPVELASPPRNAAVRSRLAEPWGGGPRPLQLSTSTTTSLCSSQTQHFSIACSLLVQTHTANTMAPCLPFNTLLKYHCLKRPLLHPILSSGPPGKSVAPSSLFSLMLWTYLCWSFLLNHNDWILSQAGTVQSTEWEACMWQLIQGMASGRWC